MTVILDRIKGVNSSIAIKVPCRAATISNIALEAIKTIDGVALLENDRVLVRAQTNSVDNGIYCVSSGQWQRASDFDGPNDVAKGTVVRVSDGITNSGQWEVSNPNPAIGTTPIVWAESAATPEELDNALAALQNAEESALANLSANETAAVSNVQSAGSTAIGNISSAEGSAITQVSAARENALNAISDSETAAANSATESAVSAATALAAANSPVNRLAVEVFDTPGTHVWAKHPNALFLVVTCVGAGSGAEAIDYSGGPVSPSVAIAPASGNGGFIAKAVISSPPVSANIHVGQGGAGAFFAPSKTNATDGGDSAFGDFTIEDPFTFAPYMFNYVGARGGLRPTSNSTPNIPGEPRINAYNQAPVYSNVDIVNESRGVAAYPGIISDNYLISSVSGYSPGFSSPSHPFVAEPGDPVQQIINARGAGAGGQARAVFVSDNLQSIGGDGADGLVIVESYG